MAETYPPILPEDTPNSEVKVFRSLRRLGPAWRVFHSVTWQSLRGRRPGDGEADFVVLHPDHGLVIIEVKGGAIEVLDGEWFSTGRSGRFSIKNPFEQAVASKHALRRFIENLDPPLPRVPVGHVVAFPDCSLGSGIGTYGPRELIFDKSDLLEPETALARALGHWQQSAHLTSDSVSRLTTLLAPSAVVRPRLKGDLDTLEAELIELTDQQIRAMRHIRRQRRAAVFGGPGTGKTILALERARTLAADGFGTLLTCFNAPLGRSLERTTADLAGVTAGTFHSLCFKLASKAGLNVPPDRSPDWWALGAPELLTQAAGRLGRTFDAIVVDEGQDFPDSWLMALAMLLSEPDDGPFYVFADDQQALFQPDWELGMDLPPFDLDINCRNSLQIAEKVAAVFGGDVLTLGAAGPRPSWVRCDGDDQAVESVQDLVARLILDEMVDPSRIVVLSDQRQFVDRLRRLVVADSVFVELDRTGVVTETIQRFKGLEADVVICVLLGAATEDLKRAAYVGFSRAKLMLIAVGRSSLRSALHWG